MKNKTRGYAFSGLLAGLANGLFGAGGGMILVPMLTRVCKLEDKKSFATAISIILPISIVSLIIYCSHGVIDFALSLPYLIGGFFGGLLGGILFKKLSANLLHKLLGLVILWGGIRLLW